MRVSLYRKLADERGFVTPVVLIVAVGLLLAGLAAAVLSTQASRMAADDRALAQARCAADTGIERAKVFLMADPLWSDGSVAEGPVDETSEVEDVTIEHATQDGKQVIVITSTGRCGGVRKTVRAVVETGLVPLISAYGGGIKQLGGVPLELSGSAVIKSDVLVNKDIYVYRKSVIGLLGEERTVYADGSIDGYRDSIRGDGYATLWINPDAFTGEAHSMCVPPVPFPDIKDVDQLISIARNTAQATEEATGEQHYFPSSKTFTSSELTDLEGIYFVEGDVYLPSGTTNAQASIVAAGSIHVTGSLSAEKVALMAAGDIVFRNASDTSVALTVAGGNVGWDNTGGGNATLSLKYGALVAGTINGGKVRGSVTLEQNGRVDFSTLTAPVHTVKVISRTEL